MRCSNRKKKTIKPNANAKSRQVGQISLKVGCECQSDNLSQYTLMHLPKRCESALALFDNTSHRDMIIMAQL